VLVIDETRSILLFRGGDPARPEAGTWWFTPGGGLEATESYREAAARELREETGLESVTLTGPVFSDDVEFEFDGGLFGQHQEFFVAHVERFALVTDGWTEQERRIMVESRWWTPAQLADTTDLVYPASIEQLLRQNRNRRP
jgi:ADP-ribose pyrophosphatase YjhB (NUDIX family)